VGGVFMGGSSTAFVIKQVPQKAMSEEMPPDLKQAKKYSLKSALEGRGQPGEAGFYEEVQDGMAPDSKKMVLIKEDDPATCLQEGSALFGKTYLPDDLKNVMNVAECRCLRVTTNDGENKIIIATVQDAIKGYPLDKAILGKKREARTWKSEESKNEEKIAKYIARFSDSVKSQFAAAIFASAVVGDESLHIGQFMVLCDPQDIPKKDAKDESIPPEKIKGIVRVDLGARERYALARKEKKDFHHKTSGFYASSGQFYKDYMSYLLKDPDIYAKYLALWIRSIGIKGKLSIESDACFMRAMDQIPDKVKNETIEKVCAIYSKGLKTKEKIHLDLDGLRKVVADVVDDRVVNMEEAAIEQSRNIVCNCKFPEEAKNFFVKFFSTPFLLKKEEGHYKKKYFNPMNEYLNTKFMKHIFYAKSTHQLDMYYKLLSRIGAAVEFSPFREQEKEIIAKTHFLKRTIRIFEDLQFAGIPILESQNNHIDELKLSIIHGLDYNLIKFSLKDQEKINQILQKRMEQQVSKEVDSKRDSKMEEKPSPLLSNSLLSPSSASSDEPPSPPSPSSPSSDASGQSDKDAEGRGISNPG
jgi:hypothetical protein